MMLHARFGSDISFTLFAITLSSMYSVGLAFMSDTKLKPSLEGRCVVAFIALIL
jgi:hypothetical protein